MIALDSPSSKLLYATTRVVARRADNRLSVGTAFFFHFAVDRQRVVPALVTNKHVVQGTANGEFLVHERGAAGDDTPTPGPNSFTVLLDSFEQRWIGHPGECDLCAMPFGPLQQEAQDKGKQIFYMPLDEGLIPTAQILGELNALEEIVMVGYPIGLWDDTNNFPILRRGITASHPVINFGGRPIGVVDIASFPGSSGSPILVLNQGTYATPHGVTIGTRVLLLGALFAGPQLQADGKIEVVEIPTTATPVARTPIPIHLGYYVKAKELLELKRHLFATLKIVAPGGGADG